MIEAMKEKDKDRLSVIRMVKASLKQEEIDHKKEINDDLLIEIVNRQIKMRKDSISEFVKAGREDLIGMAPRCLIKPREARGYLNRANSNKKGNKKNFNKDNKKRESKEPDDGINEKITIKDTITDKKEIKLANEIVDLYDNRNWEEKRILYAPWFAWVWKSTTVVASLKAIKDQSWAWSDDTGLWDRC